MIARRSDGRGRIHFVNHFFAVPGTLVADWLSIERAFNADNTACLVTLAVPPYELKTTFFAIPRCALLTSEDIDGFGVYFSALWPDRPRAGEDLDHFAVSIDDCHLPSPLNYAAHI